MVRENQSLLQGEVEIDEAFVGGARSGKRGKGKKLVVITGECSGKKRTGRIRMQRIPDALAATLELFILDNIAQGSTIHTDGWPSYNAISSLGYKHSP